MKEEGVLVKNVQNILAVLVIALLGWAGFTVINLQIKIAEFGVRMQNSEVKSLEIVPRSENERRWESLERTTIQNAERISRLEASFIRGGKKD